MATYTVDAPVSEPLPSESPVATLEPTASPSFLGRHWLDVLLFLAVFAFCVPTQPSADTWWHYATGKFIVQSHSIPHSDPFSFTAAGKPWIAHEWLADVIFYLAYKPFGSASALLLTALVLAATFLVAYHRSGGMLPARLAALALGIWAATPNFCIRPQIFTYLLVSVFIALLSRFIETGFHRPLYFLPLLSVLWVNLHGGYILGPVLVLLFAVGATCDWLLNRADPVATKRRVISLALTFAACVAVVPLNPNGTAMLTYPFATLNSAAMSTGIMEWHSPDFHLAMFWPFAALLALTIAVLALSPRRPRPSELVLFLFFSLAALYSMRHLPLFVLVAFPLAAKYAWRPDWKLPAWKFRSHVALQAAALLLVSLASAEIVSNHLDTELARELTRFPVRASAYLEQQKLPGELFNAYDFGGYLIWRLYPRYRVYIDGRGDVYGDAFLNSFVDIYNVNVDPRVALDRDGIRTVLVEPRSNLAAFLRTQPEWKRVYEDPVAVIFTR